ncbi:iron-containing alcohol dehydrogenase [Lachnospiraceae bacterium C1.1]|nr:iron-containing alcohol dehydrogenase [Lachnospiraceae bacterium C1.1]
MLEDYSLRVPGEVYGGKHALENIEDILKKNKVKKAALFSDKGIIASGLTDYPAELVKKAGVELTVIDDLHPEPSYGQVQEVADRFRKTGADFIIAIGGGSVMDAAKLASVLSTDEYTCKDLLDDPKQAVKQVKSLMIPTTAGTGAEATLNAIVAVPEKEVKVGIVNGELIPDHVILDGRMIAKLPRKIAASTGIDALCHAVECFTSKKANSFSDTFALKALDLILANIEKACDDPEALVEKGNMLNAAFYAGVAITSSGTTAVHALSYPLGGKYHIAHGVSNAILLIPVMKFNEPEIKGRLAEAYDSCCHEENRLKTVDEKSAWMIEKMESIVKHLDIPTNLSEWNVTRSDLDFLAKSGLEQQRLLVNNMRELTLEDAKMLYEQILA